MYWFPDFIYWLTDVPGSINFLALLACQEPCLANALRQGGVQVESSLESRELSRTEAGDFKDGLKRYECRMTASLTGSE